MTRMVFWDIWLNDVRLTAAMRQCINTIKVKYETNKISTAQISIESNSYLEDAFKEANDIKIYMGEFRHQLIKMIDGKIIKTPDGSASDFLSYTIDVADKIMSASYATQIINYKVQKKSAIIVDVISRNGFTPVVDIDDTGSIPQNETIIQNNITDTQFLTECAKKWRCTWWFDSDNEIVYFMDFKKAHAFGNSIKILNAKDLTDEYMLGYRTNALTNNVAKLDWKINPQQGTPTAADKNVKVNVQTGDIEFYDTTFKIKPEFIEQAKRNPQFWNDISTIAATSNKDEFLTSIKKYFVQYPANQQSTNENLVSNTNPSNVEMSIELNNPDFCLRPPRMASLKAGTSNPKAISSYLPSFLVSTVPRKLKIDMVETVLAGGYAKTSLKAIPA